MSVLSLIAEEKTKCYQGLAPNKRESAESVYSGGGGGGSGSRVLLLRRRRGAGSSGTLGSQQSLAGGGGGGGGARGERSVTQRVLSAKMHRVKQLQNQLAAAHYHLNELNTENRVLRAMQKKQEIALQRYEDSNAELPKVLNSHTEEVRAQQVRYKQLRQQHRDVTAKLKEREMELQQLRDEHHHLQELSKDRNLPEREKLQALLTELTERVTKQNETIASLQRRLTLEAKNHKHQLQQEVMRHRDTRSDLNLAINNADKLSSIIEMKERVINNGNGKRLPNSKSPTSAKGSAGGGGGGGGAGVPPAPAYRTIGRTVRAVHAEVHRREEITGSPSSSDNDQLSKLCENSRYLSSALSQDDHFTSDAEPRSRSALTNHSRTASSKSTTPVHTKKNAKPPEEVNIELAKTIQDGMLGMNAFQEQIDFDAPHDDIEKKISSMKSDLLNKIKNNEAPSRIPSACKNVEEIEHASERSSRKSSAGVVFKTPLCTEDIIYSDMKRFQQDNDLGEPWAPSTANAVEKKLKSGKTLDTYCKGIMYDIEKSSKVIDQHIKEYSTSRFDSEKLVEQLQCLDKMNEIVKTDALAAIQPDTLEELNNNLKTLATQETQPVPRKRSITGAKGTAQRSANAFGDASLSNQDLLNDLLGIHK